MRGRIRSLPGLLPALACLLWAASSRAEDPSQMVITPTPEGTELAWSDAEERIQGTVSPPEPKAGEDLTVLVHVGSFEGPAFNGPVRLGLRGPDGYKQHLVVQQGDRGWRAVFRPPEPGVYTLDVGFRTTRDKVAHARLEIREAPLPPFLGWALVAVAAVTALILGVRQVRSKGTAAEPITPP